MIGRRSLLQMLGIGGVGAAVGGASSPARDYPNDPQPAAWDGLTSLGRITPISVEEQLTERFLKYKAFGLPKWWLERHSSGLNSYREPFVEMKSWSPVFKTIAQQDESRRREEKSFVNHLTNGLAEAAWRKIHPHYP